MLPAALTALTAVFVATLDIFPLVVAIGCRVEEHVFASLLVSFETMQIWLDSTVQLFLYAGLESFKFVGFGLSELSFSQQQVSPSV